eukprot:5789746-Prymnesium_polylepis.2
MRACACVHVVAQLMRLGMLVLGVFGLCLMLSCRRCGRSSTASLKRHSAMPLEYTADGAGGIAMDDHSCSGSEDARKRMMRSIQRRRQLQRNGVGAASKPLGRSPVLQRKPKGGPRFQKIGSAPVAGGDEEYAADDYEEDEYEGEELAQEDYLDPEGVYPGRPQQGRRGEVERGQKGRYQHEADEARPQNNEDRRPGREWKGEQSAHEREYEVDEEDDSKDDDDDEEEAGGLTDAVAARRRRMQQSAASSKERSLSANK